jgi:type IV pilus assembly protein PilC
VAADIAQRQLEDSENGLEQAVGRLEPTLVVLACLLVGAILLSVMLPLSRIMTAIG